MAIRIDKFLQEMRRCDVVKSIEFDRKMYRVELRDGYVTEHRRERFAERSQEMVEEAIKNCVKMSKLEIKLEEDELRIKECLRRIKLLESDVVSYNNRIEALNRQIVYVMENKNNSKKYIKQYQDEIKKLQEDK